MWPVTITEDERNSKQGQRRLCRVLLLSKRLTHRGNPIRPPIRKDTDSEQGSDQVAHTNCARSSFLRKVSSVRRSYAHANALVKQKKE